MTETARDYIEPKTVPVPPADAILKSIKKSAESYNVQIIKAGKGGYLVIENGDMCAKTTLDEALAYVRQAAHETLGEPDPGIYKRGYHSPRPTESIMPTSPNAHDGGQPEKAPMGFHSKSDQHKYARDLDEDDYTREGVVDRIRNLNLGLGLLALGVTVATFVLGNVLTPSILAALPR